ncbi:Uncharacterised protein [Mycolicibacterium vanbaalenii]|uniref:CHK kinase-like domain-containing protein n=1 Tax=Mycolicibacterium vanbaalenii TaxID=110539 RepID=A0A5S9PNC4_MYCVN|nr:oxidoreductase family protein [Mycolicibacterium vanbaalenii]CAA0105775.1 Uncharacterised protein [Mycolicibacterium vanbaalenii]
MTPEWLTVVMQSAGQLGDDDVVAGWHASPIGEGVGLLSDLAKLELQYGSAAGPVPALIAKFAVANEVNRAVAQGLQTYEREVKFYQDLAAEVGSCCPQSYFSDLDPATGDMVLLLEDLTDYRAGDQTRGCTVAEAELALDAVARLHAATWHAEQREDLAWWPTIEGPLYSGAIGVAVVNVFATTMQSFSAFVHPDVVAAGERYTTAVPELHRRMAQGPQALIHGDYRLDNFMFGTRPDQRPFVMLDMQAPIVTKAVHDVGYLLSQSLDVTARRSNEQQLLVQYHSALVSHGVSDYSFEQCWEDYKLAILHCLEYAIIIAGTLEPGNARGRKFVEACLHRSCQAIVDLDLLSLLP